MNPNREEVLFALAQVRAHSERHQIQSSNVLEVPPIEGGKMTAAVAGGCRHDQVVVARHLSRRFQLGPNPGVFPRDFIRVGNDREEREDCFQINLSSRTVFGAGPLHAMPQLGDRDGGDFDFLSRVEREPSLQIERALLAADDDIRIEDYRHLSSGALRAARDCRRSSAHARASSAERLVLASARASSAPVQRDVVGTKRATGTAASRTTKVVCSRRARATHSARPGLAFSSAMVVSFMAQEYIKPGQRAKPDSQTA